MFMNKTIKRKSKQMAFIWQGIYKVLERLDTEGRLEVTSHSELVGFVASELQGRANPDILKECINIYLKDKKDVPFLRTN